jgi:hypothetical protein
VSTATALLKSELMHRRTLKPTAKREASSEMVPVVGQGGYRFKVPTPILADPEHLEAYGASHI